MKSLMFFPFVPNFANKVPNMVLSQLKRRWSQTSCFHPFLSFVLTYVNNVLAIYPTDMGGGIST